MKVLSLICLAMISMPGFSQVPKRIVVEHFTNTRCSVCSQTNPGFYTNLKNHPDVIHLAIHPSAPYSTCQLHLMNPVENDARTNYYNAYGGTPRFFVQGKRDPNANTSNPSLFTPHAGQSSPAQLTIVQDKQPGNTIDVLVSVKKVATDSLGSLRLFVAIAQDSLLYAAPNGELLHQDVFIEALSNIEGDALNMPAGIGDSINFVYNTTVSGSWSFKRVFVVAILQEELSKDVVQANASLSDADSPLGIESHNTVKLSVYPNPTNGTLVINSEKDGIAELYNANGVKVDSYPIRRMMNNQVEIDQSPGIYFLNFVSGNLRSSVKIALY
ncbi:MAG TPA: hypothetical protein DCX54_05625 [Flavobacteriales bacterium]|nr:hypothetical protein [Flavobacteriales bacterium]